MATERTMNLRCPACSGPMEEGNLPVSEGLIWVRAHGEDSGTFAENIAGTHAVLRANRMEAWRCRKCLLITFRYGRPLKARKNISKTTPPS